MLQTSMKQLNEHWARIKEQWDDPASVEIEKSFIAPMEPRIRKAAAALAKMAEVMHTAEKECR